MKSESESTAVSQQLQFKLPPFSPRHAAPGTARSLVACVRSQREEAYNDDALRTGRRSAEGFH